MPFSRIATLSLAVLCFLLPSLVAQPPDLEGSLRDVRRTLPGGQESPRFLASKEQWPDFEKRIELELPRQEAAAKAGGFELDQAVVRYESKVVTRSDPVNHYLYGRILGLATRLEQAKAEFDRAIALDPYFYWAYHGLGTYFAMRQMPEPAAQHFSKCLELNPNFTRATRGLALTYYSMGRLEDAEATLRRILAKEPNDVDSWIALGQVLMQSTRFSDAADVLRRAEQLEPNNGDVKLNLARCFGRSDQIEAAIPMLESLVSMPSHAYEGAMELARLHERMGQNAKAADALQIALTNLPLAAAFNRDKLVEAMAEMRARPAVVKRDANQKSWRDLVNDLQNSVEPEKRREAVKIIERLPFRHVDLDAVVLNALRDKDAVVRTIALRVITNWWQEAGQLADPKFLSILSLLAKDSTSTVRAMAVWALGKSDHPAAVPHLIELLPERNDYVFGELHKSLNRLTFGYIEVDSDEAMTSARMDRLAQSWKAWFSANEAQYRRFMR
jgi:tetratricopeptide (TPR) repeat protein